MSRPQVLIVGAGPTGLVLALWLARAGTPFRLIDKNSGPGQASRAMAVQARTLEFYRQLGIADEVVAAGFRLDRIHIRNRSRELAVAWLGGVGGGISPFPFVLSLPQDDHERMLTQYLQDAGHAVEWDTELVAFTQRDDGVSATLRKPGGEETWAGTYLCGCDGAHSAVRHGLGVGFPGGTYDQPFYVADAEAAGFELPLHEWPWTPAARDAGLGRDALYLVRPDGHIGFARQEQDVEELRVYLGRFGIAGPAARATHTRGVENR